LHHNFFFQAKFAHFRAKLAEKYNEPGFVFDAARSSHVYMRWKEHFLVNDHRVSTIKGASFAGFYYVCFCKETGATEGFYFHDQSEKFQRLDLTLVQERKFPAFEFR
jgi:hypothetical protein